MYVMNNYLNSFSGEFTNWIIDEAGFERSQCQISIYYNFAPYRCRLVVLSYVDDYVYWYISEELGKWFVDMLLNKLHAHFLECQHWLFKLVYHNLKTIISQCISIGMLHLLLKNI